MGKRKSQDSEEDSEEDINKKIRRLERKLLEAREEKTKPPRRRRVIIYSSDEDELNNHSEESSQSRAQTTNQLTVRAQIHAADNSVPPRPIPRGQPVPPSPHGCSPTPPPRDRSPTPSPRGRTPVPSPRGTTPVPSPRSPPPVVTSNQATSAEKEPQLEEIELDGDILQLLGEAPKPETPLGPPIHKDVASRWQEILAKGLPKEVKDQIFEGYLVPSNCDLLIAPTLNPETKAALPDSLVKRDMFLMHKQKQLGIALSALSSAISLIISNETSKQKLLKPISDACRLLCDNHFIETKSRRNLVISSSNTQHKDTLLESVRDKTWLFGENVSEKLKAAQSIQKSGDVLKNQPKVTAKPNYFGRNNRGNLNFKIQHRKTDNKPAPSNDNGRGRQQSRAPPPPPRSYHRSNRRSPPPRRAARK